MVTKTWSVLEIHHLEFRPMGCAQPTKTSAMEVWPVASSCEGRVRRLDLRRLLASKKWTDVPCEMVYSWNPKQPLFVVDVWWNNRFFYVMIWFIIQLKQPLKNWLFGVPGICPSKIKGDLLTNNGPPFSKLLLELLGYSGWVHLPENFDEFLTLKRGGFFFTRKGTNWTNHPFSGDIR